MANLTMSRPANGAVKGPARGRVKLPAKRSINLAGAGEKPLNLKIAIPAIILILIAAFALGKFGVADRLMALSRAQGRVSTLQNELNANYRKLEEFSELEEKYAHYTYSGMTEEELSRVDRTEAVKLIERVVLPKARLSSWSIDKNQLTLTVSAKTLQEINVIALALEDEPIVDYCQATTAATDPNYEYYGESEGVLIARNEPNAGTNADGEEDGEEIEPYHGVTAQIVAYLVTPEEEENA